MCPDHRRHRGAHPEDGRLFGEKQLTALRAACEELSWLLGRDYPVYAALKLVGDRHRLTDRQRIAVSRAACPDGRREQRSASTVAAETVRGAALVVDGFNQIITVEAAMGGGVIMVCRDGCLRDLSSVHGSYRSVEETEGALLLLGQELERLGPASVEWLLDKPISNSGRLAGEIRGLAAAHGWPWTVELAFNPDREILGTDRIAVTTDANILNGVTRWLNLASRIIPARVTSAWMVDFLA